MDAELEAALAIVESGTTLYPREVRLVAAELVRLRAKVSMLKDREAAMIHERNTLRAETARCKEAAESIAAHYDKFMFPLERLRDAVQEYVRSQNTYLPQRLDDLRAALDAAK